MLSFSDLLIVFAIVILIFHVLAFFLSSFFGHKKENSEDKVQNRLTNNLMSLAVLTVILAFIYCTIISTVEGARTSYYYVVMCILVLLVLSMAFFKIDKSHFNSLFIFTIILIVSSLIITIILGNRYYPQTTLESSSIYLTGNISAYQNGIISTGLYYYIPMGDLILIPIKYVLGVSGNLASLVAELWMIIITCLSVYIGVRNFIKVDRKWAELAGFMSALAIMATPGLNFFSRLLGLPYAPILFAFLSISASRRSYFLSIIVGTAMIFSHPSGLFWFILTVIFSYSPKLLKFIKSPSDIDFFSITNKQEPKTYTALLVILPIMALAYWSYTYILSSLTGQLKQFFPAIIDIVFPSSSHQSFSWYTPIYFGTNIIFGYAWAYTISVSAALVLIVLIKTIIHNKNKNMEIHPILFSSGLVAAAVVVIAFFMYSVSQVGQYFIDVAFFASIIAVGPTIILLLKSSKFRAISIITILLFTLFIGIGIYTPSNSPLEHPEFESAAITIGYRDSIEASSISDRLASTVHVLYDYDIPVMSGSYKGIRQAIYSIMEGVNASQYLSYGENLILLRTDRILPSNFREQSDIVYNSNYHIGYLAIKK